MLVAACANAQTADDQQQASTSPIPLIYDNSALNTRRVEVDLSQRLKVQLATPAAADGYTETQGLWRPVDSVELRAGYGVSPAAGTELGTCYQDGCSAVASEPVETYTLGASWQFSNALNLNVDYLSRQSENPAVANAPWLANNHGALNLGNSEAIDVSLVCDINAGNWGDLELGLQVSRVVNSDYALVGQTATDNAPLNSAALGVGWQKGAFRTDLTSRYLDLLEGGEQATGWTSFDVNFAWRMPWNASVSVGARNVLNNPAPQTNNLSDAEVENFFGRVPYVRYQQDL